MLDHDMFCNGSFNALFYLVLNDNIFLTHANFIVGKNTKKKLHLKYLFILISG